jgi:hypothetical protein
MEMMIYTTITILALMYTTSQISHQMKKQPVRVKKKTK